MAFSIFLASGFLSFISGAAASSASNLQACAAMLDGKLPSSTPPGFEFSGNVRQYYVAAKEIEWDYAPSGWDNWLGVPLNVSPRAQSAGVNQYGTKWLKALYRGFTDASFTTESPQPAFQGTQGPTLRAEVGDLIEIMFLNNLTSNYATMHSMGLAYGKVSEGADYPNNTMPGQNVTLAEADAVPPVEAGVAPGGCVVYKWLATEAAGPSFGELSKTHSYHSYVSMLQDTNAGLIGPSIVYAKGAMKSTMESHREFPLLYMIYNEANSFLSNKNAEKLNGTSGNVPSPAHLSNGNQSVWYPQVVNIDSAGQFNSATTFYTMNGFIFANTEFPMCDNDKVIWYVNAYGSASHVFHMHGSSFSYLDATQYAVSLNDGVGKTLFMNATAVGIWQVICHVNNHHAMGMVQNYRIYSPGNCPLPALEASNSGKNNNNNNPWSWSWP